MVGNQIEQPVSVHVLELNGMPLTRGRSIRAEREGRGVDVLHVEGI
jgi:hypothetical protein